jgi:hypothetical protein
MADNCSVCSGELSEDAFMLSTCPYCGAKNQVSCHDCDHWETQNVGMCTICSQGNKFKLTE